jgi:hypothetical protein
MPALRIVPIVEGHGEVFAVPVLLRPLSERYAPHISIDVSRPIRRSRGPIAARGRTGKGR